MKTNENKKSSKKVLVIAGMAALLALVGYMGGTTFAKYITEHSVETDTATVAKWGYVVKLDGANLFSNAYADDVKATYAEDGEGVEVQASSKDNKVVAPGTSGSFEIDVTGTAEVLSKITVTTSSTGDVCLQTTDGTTEVNYYPIQWTVSGTAEVGGKNLLDNLDLEGLTTAQMLGLLTVLNQDVVNVNTVVKYDLTISWAWAFESVDDATTEEVDEKVLHNTYDTMLGDLAALSKAELEAKYGENTPTGTTQLGFTVKVTVEQLDK